MKNISLLLNSVLLVAVLFLYYLHFSGKKNIGANSPETSDTAKTKISSAVSFAPPVPILTALPKNVRIVFVNADSIFAKYEFAKKSKAAGESRVQGYQKTYQQKTEEFQKEYNDYVDKAGKGQYSKEQGLAIEEGLKKKRDEILAMEQSQDKVMGDVDKTNADVQKKIYAFLKRFNEEHGYYCALAFTNAGGGALGVSDSLDVTRQVLAGLNAEYKAGEKK